MISVFLSYARSDDEPFVRRLYEDLTAAGFDVWYDRLSMSARMLPFPQEIRDAIAHRDRLVLVVGPAAAASDWVTAEWRFALFEGEKCVNPIIRLDGRGAAGQPIDGAAYIPEDLRFIHHEDFRNNAEYKTHLANLIRQLSEPLSLVGKLVAVPDLPPHFVTQPDRVCKLRDMLLADLTKPVVVSGTAGRVGVQGMGGIGKSVLAAALAHHPEVRRAFPDGVYWVTLGQQPHLEELQHSLLQALGDDGIFVGIEGGKQKLRDALACKAALLVLDDAWQRPHAEAFNVVSGRCRLLLTTRDVGLVTALAADENHYQVQLPTMAEAEALLAQAAGASDPLPPEALQVIEQCGRLPLALALCGGMARRKVPWTDILRMLSRHKLEHITDRHPLEEQHASIWRAIDISVGVLSAVERERFTELAVFALDTGAPETAVLRLWEHTARMEDFETRILLGEFAERSLIERDDRDGRILLHDLVHNYATAMAEKHFGSEAALHQRLLDAYQKKCPDGWPTGPNDGYFFRHLCEHLIAAEKLDDAISMLTNVPWPEAKCKVKQVFSLQEDYRVVIDAMPEAQEGLRQEGERQAQFDDWEHAIVSYAAAWADRRRRIARGENLTEPAPILPTPPQSVHMWSDEEIEKECVRIESNPTQQDLINIFAQFVQSELYSVLQFGKYEGFLLQHACNYAPGGPVHDAACAMLLVRRAPMMIRRWPRGAVWNPRPAVLRTLESYDESTWVETAIAALDGRHALSWSKVSDERVLRVWDLQSGSCLHRLKGHRDIIRRVSMAADGKRAVSESWDNTWRVWDLERGECLSVLEKSAGARLLGVTPAGHSIIVERDDHKIELLDVENGKWETVITNLDSVHSSTTDGLHLVSSGPDGTLILSDLSTCDRKVILQGHKYQPENVAVSADGRRAVSANRDEGLLVWDLNTGHCVYKLNAEKVTGVSITLDGTYSITRSLNDELCIWDLSSGNCLRSLKLRGAQITSMSVTGDGRCAISGSSDAALRVWNLESGSCSQPSGGHSDRISRIEVLSDEQHAASTSLDNTLKTWDMETGLCQISRSTPTEWFTGGMLANQRAVRMLDGGYFGVWELESGEQIRSWKNRDDRYATCVGVTSDMRRVVSGDKKGNVRVWDSETAMCLHLLSGHSAAISCLCFLSDGKRVISGSLDHSLRMWDIETGALLCTMSGHSGLVVCVAVTVDGRYAISGSREKTLRIWNLMTGDCIQVLAAPDSVSACLVLGQKVIFGTNSGEVVFLQMHNFSSAPSIQTPRADQSNISYEALLRRGLEYSLRQKGPGHEETVAHRISLAVLLDNMGCPEEATALRAANDSFSCGN